MKLTYNKKRTKFIIQKNKLNFYKFKRHKNTNQDNNK